MGKILDELNEQIEAAKIKFCDELCIYTHNAIPEGKDEDWLINDDDSPCNTICPFSEL